MTTTPSAAAPAALDRQDAALTAVELTTVTPGESLWDTAESLGTHWQRAPWPAGLLSVNIFTSLDDTTLLAVYQFRSDSALPDSLMPGSTTFRYRLHHGMDAAPDARATCYHTVIRTSEDHADAERHIDALLERLRTIPDIGSPVEGSFHIALDGSSTLLYSAWESKEAHDQHMEGMRHTMADLYAGLPAPVNVQQYRHHQTLAVPH
ncbi:hypothetical protein [Actinophytocola sediminis]